jgi:hypothetical protein
MSCVYTLSIILPSVCFAWSYGQSDCGSRSDRQAGDVRGHLKCKLVSCRAYCVGFYYKAKLLQNVWADFYIMVLSIHLLSKLNGRWEVKQVSLFSIVTWLPV